MLVVNISTALFHHVSSRLFAVMWVFFAVESGSYTFLRSSPWNGLGLQDITTGW